MRFRHIRHILVAGLAVTIVCAALHVVEDLRTPFITIRHCPVEYARRAGALTANVTGDIGPLTTNLRYRLNGGPWRDVGRSGSRIADSEFVIEFPANKLLSGRNAFELTAERGGLWTESCTRSFVYSPAVVSLPAKMNWSTTDLDVQDGQWETLIVEDEHRVRPVPGREGYDRILAVTGAFSGGRRVETDVTFRGNTSDELFGFGVLPMWGGHINSKTVPRSGWCYGAAWYYSHAGGTGLEFAHSATNKPEFLITKYRTLEPVLDARYRIVAECWPVTDNGTHGCYRQRMKWWRYGAPEPSAWIVLTDESAGRLPSGEYAVALVAHRCQVEFGAVRVSAIESPSMLRTDDRLATRSDRNSP